MSELFYLWLGSTLATLIPSWIVLGRIGRDPSLALVTVIPIFGLSVVLYVVGLGRWPNFPQAEAGL
jgi:hypothetical protein